MMMMIKLFIITKPSIVLFSFLYTYFLNDMVFTFSRSKPRVKVISWIRMKSGPNDILDAGLLVFHREGKL